MLDSNIVCRFLCRSRNGRSLAHEPMVAIDFSISEIPSKWKKTNLLHTDNEEVIEFETSCNVNGKTMTLLLVQSFGLV